jgi:hypothetical protein
MFYDILVQLWPFGKVFSNFVYFSNFGMFGPRKIWQPCPRRWLATTAALKSFNQKTKKYFLNFFQSKTISTRDDERSGQAECAPATGLPDEFVKYLPKIVPNTILVKINT